MNGLDSMMYDRFIGLSSNSIGEKIYVKLTNKDIVEGMFFSIDPFDYKFIIIVNPKKLIFTKSDESKDNEEYEYLNEEFYKINFEEIVYFKLMNKNIKQFSKADFQTDVDISKKTGSKIKKELVQFTVADDEKLFFGNLDDDSIKWDQFDLNKQKFEVKTTYDEIHYTTELDHKIIPNQVKVNAEKIAQEILEGDNWNNVHIKEERGLIAQTEEGDEEEKYSSVIRK